MNKIFFTTGKNSRFLMVLCFVSLFGSLFSETSTDPGNIIKGVITDNQQQPVEYATAKLINNKTKELVKGDVCNNKGEYKIDNVRPGDYILLVSMMGYDQVNEEHIVFSGKKQTVEKNFVLKESNQQLKAVEVVAKKKFIEQTVDKVVINPEASITSASDNVYEILKKIPGVTIDNNNNVSLKGSNGVKIMLDDKPTYLSADQLAAMLKGMQGKNVDRIEIIDHPSARYDAEGNSGIINIKTKHDLKKGINGNAFAGTTITSKFGWNSGLDLNMNNGKFNFYGNYALYDWAGKNNSDIKRTFTSESLNGSKQLIYNNDHYNGVGSNYKVGMDYYIVKNHVISAMFRGNDGHNNNNENNSTYFTDKNQNTDSSLISISRSKNKWWNRTYNLNYKWDIDSTGQSLTADADFARFRFSSYNEQDGDYYNRNEQPTGNNYTVDKFQGNTIDILTAKLDYSLPVNKNLSFESGLKTSYVNTDNNLNMAGTINQNDHFIYKEYIQAGYINSRLQLGKTMLQLGLRLENTKSIGNSVSARVKTDTTYLKLFPSFFVQQTLDKNNTINFQYSYRIGRPSYHMLNPFKWMIDPYTFNVGNPYLKPQFTHSFGIGHNFKNILISNAGLNYTDGLFTEIIVQNDANKTIYQTNANLNSSIDGNLSETLQLELFKWWRVNTTLTGVYKRVNFDAGNSYIDRFSFMGNATNNFTLPYKIELEVSGYYNSGEVISNIITRPRYSVDLGVQRKVLNDKGVIKVSVGDIFNSEPKGGGAYVKYDNVNIDVKNHWDSRRLNISFNYRFGNDNLKTRSNRSTASSEEQSRSSK